MSGARGGCVVVTGDVHHMTMRTNDQAHLRGTEAEAALEMATLMGSLGIPLTYFLTGRLVCEELTACRSMLDAADIEIAGHGYFARSPRWLFQGVFRRLLRTSSNGPRALQSWEINATRSVIEEGLGVQIRGWRDHGYEHDEHTLALLRDAEMLYWSNRVGPRYLPHVEDAGLVSLPVNTYPDHDHLIHGDVRPVGDRTFKLKNSGFAPALLDVEEWIDCVAEQTETIVNEGSVAVVLIHPACMEIVDRFRSVESLMSRLSGLEFVTAAEAARRFRRSES